MAQILDDAKLKERYEALGEEARATIYGKQVADELVKLEKVTVGAVAPISAPRWQTVGCCLYTRRRRR